MQTRSPSSVLKTSAHCKAPSPEADGENRRDFIPEKGDPALEKIHLDKSSGTNPFPSTGRTWRQGRRQNLLSWQCTDQPRGVQPAESKRGDSTGQTPDSFNNNNPKTARKETRRKEEEEDCLEFVLKNRSTHCDAWILFGS